MTRSAATGVPSNMPQTKPPKRKPNTIPLMGNPPVPIDGVNRPSNVGPPKKKPKAKP